MNVLGDTRKRIVAKDV